MPQKQLIYRKNPKYTSNVFRRTPAAGQYFRKQYQNFIIEGHRGVGLHETHNTISSFQGSIDIKLDYIELDTWLSKDNQVVVVHGVEGKIQDINNQQRTITEMTVQELKQIKLNEKNDRIPTLEEVLVLCKNKIKINIELKGEQEKLPFEVLKLVQKHEMLDQIYLSSFYHKFNNFIKEAKRQLNITSKVLFAYLFSKHEQFPNIDQVEEESQFNFSAVLLHDEKANKLFEKAKEKRIKLCCYFGYEILENNQVYIDLLDLGVSSIITNQPHTLLNFRKKINSTNQ